MNPITDTELDAAMRSAGRIRRTPRVVDTCAAGVTETPTGDPVAGGFSDRDTVTPFPVDALPPSIKRLATEGADAVGVCPSMIGVPALAVAAGAIGNAAHCEPKPGYPEPPALWCAIVGASGCGKSPALDLVLSPVQHAQAEAVAEWRRERALWDAEPEGDPPVCERMLTSDATTEAVGVLLDDAPRGLLLSVDELAGWVKSFDGYRGGRGGDAQKWLSMHNARLLIVDRKKDGLLSVPMASVSVVGGIQPGVFARTFANGENTESGLLSRLLLVRAPVSDPLWSDATVTHSTREAWAMCWRKLRALPMGVDASGCPLPVMWGLDDDAKRVFVRANDDLVMRARGADDRTRAMLAKARGYLARLALVTHLCRRADGEDADGSRIDARSMSMAARLVGWLVESAERIYGRVDDDNGARRDESVAEHVKRKGRVSASELAHGMRAFRGDTEGAKAALDRLADEGQGRWVTEQGEGGGRPTERFEMI